MEKSLLDSFNLGLLHSIHGGREGGYRCISLYSYQNELWVIAQFVYVPVWYGAQLLILKRKRLDFLNLELSDSVGWVGEGE